MKRRLISFLLAACMLITLFPAGNVFAAEPENAQIPVWTDEEVAPASGDNTKTPVDQTIGNDTKVPAATAIEDDVEMTIVPASAKAEERQETMPAEKNPKKAAELTETTEPTEPEQPEDPLFTRAQWIQDQVGSVNKAMDGFSTITAATVTPDEFVAYALNNCVDVPYVSGGRSTNGFDCCGLVWYVCNHFGIDIGTGNQQSQINYGTAVDYSLSSYDAVVQNLQKGDLIFFDYDNTPPSSSSSDHVAIYVGNGQILQAHTFGTNSRVDNLTGGWIQDASGNWISEWRLICGIRRVLASDLEPPVIEDELTARYVCFADGSEGAILTFHVSDNIGVASCKCNVWQIGYVSQAHTGLEATLSGNTATLEIKPSDFGVAEGLFCVNVCAYDAAGNQSVTVQLDEDSILSFFDCLAIKDYIGTYKVKNNTTPYNRAPYRMINGVTTTVGFLNEGDKVSSVGIYANTSGTNNGDEYWLQLEDGTWIKGSYVTRCSWWTNLLDWLSNFFNEHVLVWNKQLVTSASGGTATATLHAKTYMSGATACTVTYNANGGTISSSTGTFYSGSPYGFLPTPSRFGYTFNGWFTAPVGGEQITASSTCSGDITLYAHWTRTILSQGSCGDNLTYILYGDGILDISGSGDMTSYPWSSYNARILEVNLPDGLTSIYNSAFNGCKYLESVTLPDSLATIGEFAFQNCKNLSSITIPNGGVQVNRGVFTNCTALETVYAPDSTVFCSSTDYSNNTVFMGTNTTLIITKETGKIADYYLAAYTDQYSDTSSSAVYRRGLQNGIKKIVIEEGITEIGQKAFYNKWYNNDFRQYNTLDEIVIPATVVEIGESAFAGSGLPAINLPAGDSEIVTRIGNGAFSNCVITSISIPEGVITLNSNTFSGCSLLENVDLPSTLLTVGSYAFSNCITLQQIALPRGVTTVDSNAFANCKALTSVSLPAMLTTIGYNAFENCSSLSSIDLPDSLATIGEFAFKNCKSLSSITIPNGGVQVNRGVFTNCTALETVYAPDSTVFCSSTDYSNNTVFMGTNTTLIITKETGKIADYYLAAYTDQYSDTSSSAVYRRGLQNGIKKIVIEEGITEIGQKAFYNKWYNNDFWQYNTLEDIELPSTIVSIKNSAFEGCGLHSITMPDDLLEQGTRLFYNCKELETITLPKKLTFINDYNFYGCSSLKSIMLHDRLMKIGTHAFDGAGLETVVVPSSVTEMGTYVFANCTDLVSATLPFARRKVEDYTFYNCSSLTSITLPRLVDTVGVSAFQGCSSMTEINWSQKIASIGNSAFRGCAALQEVTVPDTVTSIGTYAFADCTSLTDVTLPEVTPTLPNYLFSGCTAIETFVLPAQTTAINEGAFSGCSSLANITLPADLQTIGAKAFYDCDALQSIEIPTGTDSFGNQCFYDCDTLASLSLPNSVTSIGAYFCYSCDALAALTLSEGLTTIPEAAFMDCAVLNNVTVPRRVTSLSSNAFNVCPSMTWIMIPVSVTTMAGNALSYPDRTMIYGRVGSYAESYADQYGYEFVEYEVNATGVTLSESELTIPRGKTAAIVATVAPVDYTDDVTWKTTNSAVATVSDTGVITAVSTGEAIIRIVVGNFSASCRVTVVEPVTKVTLNKTTLTLDARETATLTATVTPSAATIKTVAWTSSNENVAAVDENGVVTAVGKGTAMITATAEDGTGIFAACAVTVTGDYIIAENVGELQSPHPYDNSSKDYWSYTVDGAGKLFVTFSELTTVEEDIDYLYVYDGNENLVGTYTGDTLAGQTIEIPGDTVVIKLVSDNTYSEYGFAVVEVSMVEPPHVHSFGGWVLTQEPSCTETGIETRTCSLCGEEEIRTVDALGHDYRETAVAPTCVEPGCALHTCVRCADTYEDDYTEPLGHNMVQGICTRCGTADPTYTDAALHVYGVEIHAVSGTTVAVPVMIEGGAAFAGFTMTITLSDGLTLKNIEKGEILNSPTGSLIKNVSQGKANWNDTVETVGDGELLLLTIEVLENAAIDESITIRLKDNKATNMADINGNAITTRFDELAINTKPVLPGDTNGDDEIDSSDAVRLVRFLVDLVELTAFQKKAADVNHDNDITSADAIRLVQYLIGSVDTLEYSPTRTVPQVVQAGAIVVANVTGEPGDTVLIPVAISDNPGFAGFTMEVCYPSELQLIGISKGNLLKTSESGAFTNNLSRGLVNWNDVVNVTGDGELCILTFHLRENAAAGQYTVSVTPKDGKQSNFANEAGQSISPELIPGTVQLSAPPFTPCEESGECPGKVFADMPAVGHWAHDAIDWALENGITAGTSKTTFSPRKACTRAEIVTFLWRAAGSPEPAIASCAFSDVTEDAYYRKAVLWAVEAGITSGTSETTFSPNKSCSRAEAVTFLWRANGSPEPKSDASIFADVPTGAYYEKAVLWANESGITAGIADTTFGSTSTCTRAQIVTFLFRGETQ